MVRCSTPAYTAPKWSGAPVRPRVAGPRAHRSTRALRTLRPRLDERRASRVACLSCGLCAQLAWASRYWCTMRTGELGRRNILGWWRNGFLTSPKCSEAPVRPRPGTAARGRSILLGTLFTPGNYMILSSCAHCPVSVVVRDPSFNTKIALNAPTLCS